MKKLLLIISITSLVLFASCKKDNHPTPPPVPVPNDTLSAGWQKMNFIDSSSLVDIFFINNTGFAVSSNIYCRFRNMLTHRSDLC
ncbi:MAG: hypothetical protein KGM16_13640 [Bacteroidota bacterium]|nr:hypothetical protein [Bacteroidota bacterium]